MPTTIVPSLSEGKVLALQKAAEIFRPTLMPSLVPGEKLNVLVLGDSLNGKTLLQVKNSTLLAESPLPLQSGQTLTVQVDQIRPLLVLRTISAPDQEISITNQFLKSYRSNPDALKEVMNSLNILFTDGTLKQLSHLLSKRETQNLHNILKQIIISDDNISNPLFLKDYIGTLGLTGERRLLKALSDPSVLKEQARGITLKETLLNLSAELTVHQTATGDDSLDGLPIRQFSDLANRAATVIESLQIVNVLAQQQDGLYMLQLPIQFPGGIRMQEIFIEADPENGKENAERQCRVVLFLDMDSLGELAVDMGISNAALNCTIKCQDQQVFDFLQPLLPTLSLALSETDYTVGVIQCILERDVRSWMQTFLQDHSLFTQNSIDLSI
jgi:hypothetical protein